MDDIATLANSARAWPFDEARRLVTRVGGKTPDKGQVLFQTGYGPSGLPHTGTFGEVARTSMVRHAFEVLTDGKIPTDLICFSDDLDGFRKVPTNVPNQDMLAKYIGMPLTKVPDPYDEHESFAHQNNGRLRAFLDSFGFHYTFVSSTEQYQAGTFDEALLKILERFDDIMAIMLPTLGPERRETYSPFMPISPTTGRVLQVPTLERKLDSGTIIVEDEDGSQIEVPVTGGHCKLQWKPDWAMRQYALGVDYEMNGKDLIDSAKVGSRIMKVLGGRAVDGFAYELFLDEKGEKISKSKGNGLTMEEWLAYAPPESLAYFMFQKPRTAKRLFFDVIPKSVDEYLSFANKLPDEPIEKQLENPTWHMHSGKLPNGTSTHGLSFALLLNLVSAANASDKSILWGFIERYAPGANAENAPMLDRLADYAIAYYRDFVEPTKNYRAATTEEAAALTELADSIEASDATTAEDLQSLVFLVGKNHNFEPLRNWFTTLYQVLLGQDQGPRFGSFIALYGKDETVAMIRNALARA